MIGAAVSGLILWAIIRIFSKHEGDDDIYKILFICLGATILSLVAHFTIGGWASHIDIPIIFICLLKYCYFKPKAALKVVGIYLLLVVIIPLVYDELTSEPLGDTIKVRVPGGETIELNLNREPENPQN